VRGKWTLLCIHISTRNGLRPLSWDRESGVVERWGRIGGGKDDYSQFAGKGEVRREKTETPCIMKQREALEKLNTDAEPLGGGLREFRHSFGGGEGTY